MAKPVADPIYLSTTYRREPDGSYEGGYVYSRAGNPNRRKLETELSRLEGGQCAFAFASGMAAIHALFASLSPGDHLLYPDDVYYNVRLLVRNVFERWGLQATAVDMTDLAAVRGALRQNTRLIWVETPSNPRLKVTDIAAMVRIASAAGARVAVDNTWPTPVHTRPLDLGASFAVHSSTKYFGGHSDLLGGALIAREEDAWSRRIGTIQHVAGGVPSPMDCYYVSRGLQTLDLRVSRQSATAIELARFLEEHPAVRRVLYPGLPSHPQHGTARKQMRNGCGGMLSLLVGDSAAEARSVTHRLRCFTTATSLGGVESLVEHRRSVEGDASATPENLLRVSVGIEPAGELIADWAQALQSVKR